MNRQLEPEMVGLKAVQAMNAPGKDRDGRARSARAAVARGGAARLHGAERAAAIARRVGLSPPGRCGVS